MSTIVNEMPAYDSMVNTVKEAIYLKQKMMRKVRSVSGVDILGGVLDTVEKVDKSIDNIPYYDKVEELARGTFGNRSDDMLRAEIFRNLHDSVRLTYQAVTGKSMNRSLMNRDIKKKARIISACLVTPSVGFTLLALVETRRRRNANESPPNQVTIPKDVVEIFASQNQDMLKHLFGNE